MWIWPAFVVLGLVGEQFRRFSLQPMTRTRQRARQRRGARRGHCTPVGINAIQKRLDATKCDATGPERRQRFGADRWSASPEKLVIMGTAVTPANVVAP